MHNYRRLYLKVLNKKKINTFLNAFIVLKIVYQKISHKLDMDFYEQTLKSHIKLIFLKTFCGILQPEIHAVRIYISLNYYFCIYK